MKKLSSFLAVIITILLIGATSQAQIAVTVTNPTNTTPNLAASYTSLADAITALNGVTGMTGPVILTLTAGGSETAPPTGFTLGSATLNPVLSSTNTITINSSGGTVTLNAGVGTATPSSAAPDGIFKLVGADFVTIDGLTFTDGNVTNPATMEFGIALFKLSAGDGSNNNTIKNCTFNMQRVNNASGTSPMIEGAVGILVINSTPTAATTILIPTNGGTLATNGTNSNNKIYTNTINGGNYGIGLSGYLATTGVGPAPVATTFLGDLGNDVGGSSSGQGNTILNYGGGASTNPAAGIRANNQWGINISYNTINNNNGSGVNHATTLRGIYAQAGTSANATISNNIVTVKSGATTSALTAIENAIGSTAASNTVTISYNTVQNCSYTTATSGAFVGIVNSASAATVNLNNNTVTNNALPGTGAFTGLDGGAPTNLNIFSNTVNNNTKTGASGTMNCTRGSTAIVNYYSNNVYNNGFTASSGSSSCILYGYYNFGSPTVENIYSNNIYNLSIAGTNTASGSLINGIHTNTTSGATKNIFNNSIRSFNIISGTINGISQSLGTAVKIYNNNLYDLNNTGSSGVVYGITITSGTVYAYNNYITQLYTANANVTDAIRGINITSSTSLSTVGIYFNTIYLNATSLGTNFGSTGVYHTTSTTATTAALDMRNNIIVNNSTPNGTGLTVAYRRSSTTLTNFSSTSNNNCMYAGTPGTSRLIFYDGTNSDQTIGAYKTRVASREAASFTELPPFVNVSSTPYDLHIQTTVPTQLEKGGLPVSTPIAITDDYDGNIRNVSLPDVGADEGDFTPLDLTPPVITYTPLPNTGGTGNRTLSATITDGTGVPTTGLGLPVLYWAINSATGPFTAVTASYISGNQYNFTFGSGVVSSDVVYYYIVAQDIVTPTPNVGAQPSAGAGGFTASPPAASTPPTTPSSYSIVGAISGTVLVGAGQTYTSLTADAADGLFKAINNKVVTGNVTVKITSDLTETGAVALNQTSEEAIYTIKIEPNDATVKTISGSYAGALIRLNGADGITFDGRFGGSGDYLTFTNLSTAASSGVFQLISLGTGAGATNNTIRNCTINTSSSSVITYGVSIGGSTIGTTGADNDNNSILNNVINTASTAIYAYGTTALTAGGLDNLTISGNTITSNTSVATLGIQVGYALNSSVAENTIDIQQNTSNAPVAISIETGVNNTTVSRNLVKRSAYTGTGGYGGRGITVGTGSASSNITLSNNMIYGVTGDNYSGFGASSSIGIAIGIVGNSSTLTTTTGGVNLYYNSVNMYGNYTRATACLVAALYVGSGASALDIRNNVFANSMDNLGTASKSYAVYSAAAKTAFTNINYNDYYASGAEGILGYMNSGDRATIAEWQDVTNGTGQDVNSLAGDPKFTSNTNLHIITTEAFLNGKATPIAGITVDFDGNTRDLSTPDIGADEYVYVAPSVDPPLGLTATATSSSTIDLTWGNNANGDPVMLISNTTNAFDEPLDGTSYPLDYVFPSGAVVRYSGTDGVYSHSGLAENSTVYYKAYSYDGSTMYSAGVTANATTPFGIPYTQNFNASTSYPSGWTGDMSIASTHGASSTNGLYKNLYSSVLTCYATGPVMGTVAASTFLNFDYRIVNYTSYPSTATVLASGDGNNIQVQISTNGGTNYSTIYTIDYSNHVTSTSFATKSISLAAYAGKFIKFKVLGTWGAGDYYVDFDNFEVKAISVLPPASFSAAASSATQVNLTFTPNASSHNVVIVWNSSGTFTDPSGPPPAPGGSLAGGTLLYEGTSSPQSHSGLTAGTTYYYKAFSYNSGQYSSGLTANATTPFGLPYTQDFNAALTLPAGWTQTSTISNRWTITASTNAGGTVNEAKATYASGTGTSRLISPPLSTTGMTGLKLSFKQFFDDYDIGITYKVQSSSDLVNWTDEAWTNASGSGNTGPGTVTTTVLNNLGGVTYVAFVLVGDHYNFDYWYQDDVSISEIPANDVGTFSVDVNTNNNPGTITPKATVKNYGSATQTFPVQMTITGGYTSTKTVTSLAGGATTQVTFDDWTAALGEYTVNVCTQLPGDADASNDCLSKNIGVFTGTLSGGTVVPAGGATYLGSGVGWTDYSVTPRVGYLFSIGGNTGSGLGTECYKYNVNTGVWTAIASLPDKRVVLATAIVGNYLYAIGGSNGTVYQSTVYRYDILGDSWSPMATLPAAIAWGKAISYNNKIYLAGGYDGTTYMATVYVYDVATNTWAAATSMPGARIGGAFSHVGNTLVYVGGADASFLYNTVFEGVINPANPLDITWTTAMNPYPGNGKIFSGNGEKIALTSVPNKKDLELTSKKKDVKGKDENNDKITKERNEIKNEGDTRQQQNNNMSPMVSYPGGALYKFDAAPWGNNEIIITGGNADGGWTPISPCPIYRYNPATDSWTWQGVLNTPELGASMGTVDVGNGANHDWKLVVATGYSGGASLTETQIFTDQLVPASRTLVVKSLLQGLFDGSTMLAKSCTIELKNASFSTVESKSFTQSGNGEGTLSFTVAANATPYWIVVKYDNGIETWSAAAVQFSGSYLAYDFTTAANKAYGDNQILVGTKYCIYTGDINQDGTVDLNDAIPILSDYDNLDYHALNDLNLDATIDLNDAIFVLSGYDNLIGAVIPSKLSPLKKGNKSTIDKKAILEKIESLRVKLPETKQTDKAVNKGNTKTKGNN